MAHASPSSAHTPGPWFADLVDLVIYTSGDTASKVAVVHQQPEPSDDSDVTSCNAHLIAAAPVLLEALRDATDALNDLYASKPILAGEHFGMALHERMKDALAIAAPISDPTINPADLPW